MTIPPEFQAVIDAADRVVCELTLGLANQGRDKPAQRAILDYLEAKILFLKSAQSSGQSSPSPGSSSSSGGGSRT